MKHVRFTRFILLLIIASVLGIGTQPIQASGIEMKLNLGFGGYVIPGKWVPFNVQFNHRMSEADLEIIKINQSQQYPVEHFSVVNLNQLEIPIYMEPELSTLKVRLCKEGFCLAEQVIDVGRSRFPGHLILSLNMSGSEQQEIERALQPEEPVLVVPIRFLDLPRQPLSYDGVSRIVMYDPGTVLTPNQSRSLQSWMSSGGRLLILKSRPVSESIITNLGYSNSGIEKVPPAVIQVGLGNLKIIPLLNQPGKIPNISGPGRWRQLLDLKPYSWEARTHISQYIPDNPGPKSESADFFNFSAYVAAIVAFWAFVGLILILLTRFQWRQVCLFTIIASILMVPIAGWLRTNWHRGVDSRVWAVILPDQGGTIIRSQIAFNHQSGKLKQASPWGVGLSLEKKEYGELCKKKNPPTWWKHQSPNPLYLNQSSNSSLLDLTGWFPDLGLGFMKSKPFISKNLNLTQRINAQDIFRYDRQTWFRLTDERTWVKASSPEWLNSEMKWKSKMHALIPDAAFMVGRGHLPSSVTLRVEGFPLSEVYWIMPWPNSDDLLEE